LDAHQFQQPDLETLAAQAELSVFHLHRLFTQWAAITPKHFLQCLTVSHAKRLLHEGKSVLDAALDTGLSGPGRLHDLCVGLESASPGEIKSCGQGWTLAAGYAETPFGRALIAESPRGVCHLSFADGSGDGVEWEALRKHWPAAAVQRDDAAAARLASVIFNPPAGERSSPPLKAFVRGTAFQVRVWRALLQIPGGQLTSYGRLAEAIGQPTASRAVGSAVGRNPVSYLIPCHRVIRETGAFGEYRWDPVRKKAMIAWENGGEG
jgi:AraC family transcriptional regulator of adaptative response/methylated-DNA-[protein]-cysteine methyltransferase